VPALGLADGRAMFESAAIVTHLVTAHADKGMAPQPGTPDHGIFLSWLVFMAANLLPAVDWAMNLEHFVEDAGKNPRFQEIGTARFNERMAIVARHLAEEGPYMMGKDMSALDLYLFMFTLWAKPSEAAARAKFPDIARVADAVRARPKHKAVLEAHGVLKPAA
jgi:glutathione S-transferase